MASILCEVCQRFDIRKLLLESAAQGTTSAKGALTGYLEVDLLVRPGLPEFYKHHETIAALKATALSGCEFCNLILRARSPKEQDPVVDDWLDANGQGQIFIGTGSCSVAKRESPYIMASQRPANNPARVLCNLEPFTTLDNKARRECTYLGRSVAAYSDAPACYTLANEWLQDCIRNHKDCGPLKSFPSPSRLINVGSKTQMLDPFLDTDSNRGGCTWAALSYQWGGCTDFMLTAGTYDKLTSGFHLKELPSTLRDAILVTRELGLTYLWIDALCILQDSADDWKAESGRMRDVYGGAAITIVAANSLSTDAGIHSARPLEGIDEVKCQLPWLDAESVFLRPASHISRRAATSSPWFTRGWTFQEGLLSPRTLSYGRDQMTWECGYHSLEESGHIHLLEQNYDSKDLLHKLRKRSRSKFDLASQVFDLKGHILLSELHNSIVRLGFRPSSQILVGQLMQSAWGVDPYMRWADVVSQFSLRNFTVATDILPALSGIAQEFAAITKDTYCAGMWKTYILDSLMWWRQSLRKSKKDYPTEFTWFSHMDWKKPGKYKAPSWSWASINAGRVNLPIYQITNAPTHSMASVVSLRFQSSGGGPFGWLEPGSAILMKGCLFPLHNLAENYWRFLNPPISHTEYLANSDKLQSLYTGVWPSLQELIQVTLNAGFNESFEFEQQHISHPNQQSAASLLVYTEGLKKDSNTMYNIGGTLAFLLVESTGTKKEYRRIGIINLDRPVVYASTKDGGDKLSTFTSRADAKKAQARGEFTWSASVDTEERRLEKKVWEEIPKNMPKATTIRLV